VAHGVSRNVLLSGGFGYHNLDGDGFSGSADIIPLTFNADVVFPMEGKVHPWIGGGLGAYSINMEIDEGGIFAFDEGETNLGINLGMGLGGPMGATTTWGAAFRYHSIFEGDVFNDLQFVTFQFGVGFLL
jgi:opacity protein-like surface antigen